jgi:hypothetical protein
MDTPEGEVLRLEFLSEDTLGYLLTYLSVEDTIYLTQCSRSLHHFLPRFSTFTMGKFSASGEYNDVERLLLPLKTKLPLPLHSVHVSVKWKDQGWGNQKGTLLLHLTTSERVWSETLISPAPQHWSVQNATKSLESPLIRNSVKGDRLELWRYVGGGGGHSLSIAKLVIHLRYESKLENERRVNKAKEKKQELAEYVAFTSLLEPSQFSASSQWDNTTLPECCKLETRQKNGLASGWAARANDASQWLQVDLKTPHRLIGVALQARGDGDQFVKRFKVSMSLDGKRFYNLNNGDTYRGVEDAGSSVCHKLPPNCFGRYVRIHPISWFNHVAMRCGVNAEPLPDNLLKDASNFVEKALEEHEGRELAYKAFVEKAKSRFEDITDAQLSCSSEWDQHHQTHSVKFIRIDAVQGPGYSSSWCAGANDGNQWVQVDFLSPVHIKKVATQGRGDATQWVTKYRIGVSLDGYKWNILNKGEAFDGNFDQFTVVVHEIEGYGRYLRLFPVEWNEHISMRIGVDWNSS